MHLKREQIWYFFWGHSQQQPSGKAHSKVNQQDCDFLTHVHGHHAFCETTAEAEPQSWPQRWCVCLAYSYTFYSPASCYHRLKYLKVFCYCMTPWLLLTVSMLYKYNGVDVAKWPYYTLGRWPHYTRNSGYKVIHIERWSQYANGRLGSFHCKLMHFLLMSYIK